MHTQDIGKVTVSHIFHLDFLSCSDMFCLVNHDSLETILVNTNVYMSHTGNDVCMAAATCGVSQCHSEHDVHGRQLKGAVVL